MRKLLLILLLAGPLAAQTTISGVATMSGTITCGPTSAACVTPAATPGTGTYSIPQYVTASTSTSGATVFFTEDGSTPATTSAIESGAVLPSTPSCTVIAASASAIASDTTSGRSPGDVVCISTGNYDLASSIFPTNSGNAGAWITVTSYNGPVMLQYTGTGLNAIFQLNGSSFPNGPSYWKFNGLAMDGANTAGEGIGCSNAANIQVTNSTFSNFGESGVSSVNCDYMLVDHVDVFHSGYNTGWSSGISFDEPQNCDLVSGFCGHSGTYSGFHNYITNSIVSGEFDASVHHSDGNGIIYDNGGVSGLSWPNTLFANDVIYGNGGRAVQCDFCQNLWIVNVSTYKDGLDQNQAGSPDQVSEMTIHGGVNIHIINSTFSSYDGNDPVVIESSSSGVNCGATLTFGGTNSASCNTGSFTISDPGYINPTAVASPAYVNGNSGQYANTLPWAVLETNLWATGTAVLGAGVDPTGYTTDSNLISDLSAYVFLDPNGIVRPHTGQTLGAFQYQVGTIKATNPFVANTTSTIKAIAAKSGMTNSTVSTATYTVTAP